MSTTTIQDDELAAIESALTRFLELEDEMLGPLCRALDKIDWAYRLKTGAYNGGEGEHWGHPSATLQDIAAIVDGTVRPSGTE